MIALESESEFSHSWREYQRMSNSSAELTGGERKSIVGKCWGNLCKELAASAAQNFACLLTFSSLSVGSVSEKREKTREIGTSRWKKQGRKKKKRVVVAAKSGNCVRGWRRLRGKLEKFSLCVKRKEWESQLEILCAATNTSAQHNYRLSLLKMC